MSGIWGQAPNGPVTQVAGRAGDVVLTAGDVSGVLVPEVVQRAVPIAGGTVNANAGTEVLLLAPAATLATLTVNFPGAPADGHNFRLATTKAITALTMGGGVMIGTLTALALGGGAAWKWSATDAAWIRLQ